MKCAPQDRIRSCRDQSSWLDLPSDNEAFGPSSFEAHGVTHSFVALFTFERAIQLNIRGQESGTTNFAGSRFPNRTRPVSKCGSALTLYIDSDYICTFRGITSPAGRSAKASLLDCERVNRSNSNLTSNSIY